MFLVREESGSTGNTPEFTVAIIYGMAGLVVVGAVAFFWYSNRKLKNERDSGQTGIDPSKLYSVETSHSVGGYRTNRGESYLIEDADHEEKRFSKTPI